MPLTRVRLICSALLGIGHPKKSNLGSHPAGDEQDRLHLTRADQTNDQPAPIVDFSHTIADLQTFGGVLPVH